MSDKRTESRRRVLESAKFSVDAVTLPGGAERHVIVHPGAVVVLPLLSDGRVVLIRNQRFAVGRALWELPAGTLEPGEPPDRAAARELEEETGYRAARLNTAIGFYSAPGFCDEYLHGFIAEDLEHVGAAPEPTEQIETHPLPLPVVLQMIERGEIADAKTIALILWWRLTIPPHRGLPRGGGQGEGSDMR